MKNTYVLLVILLLPYKLNSQSYIPTVSVESGVVIFNGKQAPFWLYSNQYSNTPAKGKATTLYAAAQIRFSLSLISS